MKSYNHFFNFMNVGWYKCSFFGNLPRVKIRYGFFNALFKVLFSRLRFWRPKFTAKCHEIFIILKYAVQVMDGDLLKPWISSKCCFIGNLTLLLTLYTRTQVGRTNRASDAKVRSVCDRGTYAKYASIFPDAYSVTRRCVKNRRRLPSYIIIKEKKRRKHT